MLYRFSPVFIIPVWGCMSLLAMCAMRETHVLRVTLLTSFIQFVYWQILEPVEKFVTVADGTVARNGGDEINHGACGWASGDGWAR